MATTTIDPEQRNGVAAGPKTTDDAVECLNETEKAFHRRIIEGQKRRLQLQEQMRLAAIEIERLTGAEQAWATHLTEAYHLGAGDLIDDGGMITRGQESLA